MFEISFCLFTGALGIIIFLLMVFRQTNNRNINIYFMMIVILGSLRFLAHGLGTHFPIVLSFHKQINYSFSLSAWPLMYLYFKKLTKVKASFKSSDILHFVAPISITSIIWLKNYLNSEFFYKWLEIGMIYSLGMGFIYAFLCYKLLKKNVWNRNSEIFVIENQNKIIKQWTKFLFVVMMLLFIRFILLMAKNNDLLWLKSQNQYIWVGALFWIAVYLKMLYSPEILYGYQEFQNKIHDYKKNAVVFDQIWIKSSKEVLNIQDAALKEKIEGSIQKYILEIEHVAINTELFLIQNCKITDLANKFNIPKSHVNYIFKYHSKVSFSDFKKIIRIQKATLLIEEGFLKTSTLETLAANIGFSSYSTFFKSFKSITGVSPQEYVKK